MMRAISFWRRHRGLLMTGLIVILLLAVGGGIIQMHTRTQVCGGIILHWGGQGPATAADQGETVTQVEQCFVQAYRQCQNASMSVLDKGIDTRWNETLTVVPQYGQCQITSSWQDVTYGTPSTHPATYTCQGLTLTPDSLVLKRCGNNADVIIPR